MIYEWNSQLYTILSRSLPLSNAQHLKSTASTAFWRIKMADMDSAVTCRATVSFWTGISPIINQSLLPIWNQVYISQPRTIQISILNSIKFFGTIQLQDWYKMSALPYELTYFWYDKHNFGRNDSGTIWLEFILTIPVRIFIFLGFGEFLDNNNPELYHDNLNVDLDVLSVLQKMKRVSDVVTD